LHLKLAGARADTYGPADVDNFNRRARDITFPKSSEAILPDADEPLTHSSSILGSSGGHDVKGESGLNADDEQ
jgi:hypothetical protein